MPSHFTCNKTHSPSHCLQDALWSALCCSCRANPSPASGSLHLLFSPLAPWCPQPASLQHFLPAFAKVHLLRPQVALAFPTVPRPTQPLSLSPYLLFLYSFVWLYTVYLLFVSDCLPWNIADSQKSLIEFIIKFIFIYFHIQSIQGSCEIGIDVCIFRKGTSSVINKNNNNSNILSTWLWPGAVLITLHSLSHFMILRAIPSFPDHLLELGQDSLSLPSTVEPPSTSIIVLLFNSWIHPSFVRLLCPPTRI